MNEIRQYCELTESEALFLEPSYFDEAIVGITCTIPEKVIYSKPLIIELLVEHEGLSEEEAEEHFDYNISGAYMGDNTPIYMHLDIWRN